MLVFRHRQRRPIPNANFTHNKVRLHVSIRSRPTHTQCIFLFISGGLEVILIKSESVQATDRDKKANRPLHITVKHHLCLGCVTTHLLQQEKSKEKRKRKKKRKKSSLNITVKHRLCLGCHKTLHQHQGYIKISLCTAQLCGGLSPALISSLYPQHPLTFKKYP